MSTPHNNAQMGDIAQTVLMPGDPLRARFIANTFLDDAKCINEIRNMNGYTGTYKGKKVTVMGSGMGMPSIGIYSYELYKYYGVNNIIRIGSAGSYSKDVKIFDVLLATSAYSESTYAYVQNGYDKDIIESSSALDEKITMASKMIDIPLTKGRIHSSDVFYREGDGSYVNTLNKEKGCMAVEMESFALFSNARILNKNASCLLTISDSLVSHEATSAAERQNSFTNMMKIALEAITLL